MKSFRLGARILRSLKTKAIEEVQKFEDVFPRIVSDLTDEFSDIPEGKKWFSQVLNYNVPSDDDSKGLMVPLFYKVLEDPSKLTPASSRNLPSILGLCLELNRAALLIQGDILSAAETRRGKPCWYKLENVGAEAANDGILLRNAMFEVLRQYFSQDPFYVKYMELFQEIAWKFAMARAFDVITVKEGKSDLSIYTPSRYETMVRYKAESNSLLFPVTLAMYLAEKYDPVVYAKVKPVLEELDRLHRVNDDFLDVYGDPSCTGYAGTDIKNGGCTWLICAALQRANLVQKSVLQANYGRDDPEAVRIVKQIYDELNMEGAYVNYEERKLGYIKERMGQISKGLPYGLFVKFLEHLLDVT